MLTTATPSDIPTLLQLVNSAYRGEPSRRGWTTEADLLAGDIRTDADDLAALMARPDAVILKAADEAGNLSGCVFLEKRGNRLYLGMLSVWPELQGQGIGKILLQAAEERARRLGCRAVYMRVLTPRHELLAWYERHGYRPTGEYEPYNAPPQYGVPQQALEFAILEKVL
ncbi:MAG: GNAT family N-acetyltransferase [Saprospiraceae bacterium]|jgi:GNAT superfamily N-acetyltransferase|nr:GNAT family N-acetyltransferase [Saprospiraceae bacterium]